MKLCYQVATPDVAVADSVTAFQGPIAASFQKLSALGYDGVELMTLNPGELDWGYIKGMAETYGLTVAIVCTGEIFGQLGLSYTHPDREKRVEAVARTREIIDFAAYLGANINIGRIRGTFCEELAKEETIRLAVAALQELSDYAINKNVTIALETVTLMQTDFINTMAEAVAMIKRVDRRNFGLMMDIFHMNIEEKNLLEGIRAYSPYNLHVHLSDNNRHYPGHCGFDFEKIFQTFKDCGYDGNFCTEIFQLPNMEEAAAGAIRHLAPILETVYERRRK